MKLVFSRAAVNDLARLREFIARQYPDAAQRIAQRLRGAIQGLVSTPQIGRPVADLSGEVRELIFGKYVIRYKIKQPQLFILRIWHGKEER
ncbi:MAG: type II toxin-antitoxin system RelE/ParE family toxin [Desulfobacterales bacterium]